MQRRAEIPDSSQRAFCSDEGGTIRAAADGKAITCLSSGEAVETASPGVQIIGANVPNSAVVPAPSGNPAGSDTRSTTTPPPGMVARRVQISDEVSRALCTTKIAPVYPPIARQARVQGDVILKAVIGKSGDVLNLQFISGPPMLAQAAIRAVKQWKYEPYLLNGTPVEVETQVTVSFRLTQAHGETND